MTDTPAPTSTEPTDRDDAFRPHEPVVLFDRKHRLHLVFLAPGKRLHLQVGAFEADTLIGQLPGTRFATLKGEYVSAYRPTLEEYVLFMPRGAAIIPPKDIGYIMQMADVGPGQHVVEAGIGSGALTLSLLRGVGPAGKVTAYELREDHANRAMKNIHAWREPLADRLEVHIGDVVEGLAKMEHVDRIILDMPEPWPALDAAAQALRPGGILLCYLPTIRQVDRLALAILDQRYFSHPDVVEVLVRPWMADRTRLRPAMRMVSHTGFLVRARRRGVARVGSEEGAKGEEGSGEERSDGES